MAFLFAAPPDGLFGLANVFIEGQSVKWLRLPNWGNMHSQSANVSAYRNRLARPIPIGFRRLAGTVLTCFS